MAAPRCRSTFFFVFFENFSESRGTGTMAKWQSGKFCVNLHGAQAYIASFVIFLYDNSWSRLGKMTLKFGGGISSPLRDRGQKVPKIDP